MNAVTPSLGMRSPLISQWPRRSSSSQPYTDGTLGHFAMARTTESSITLPGHSVVHDRFYCEAEHGTDVLFWIRLSLRLASLAGARGQEACVRPRGDFFLR